LTFFVNLRDISNHWKMLKRIVISCLFLFAISWTCFGDTPEINLTEDIVYKQIDGTPLKLDLYQSKNIPDGKLHPVFIYFHGGAWMYGSCREVRGHFLRDICTRLMKDGYSVVSVEYRLISKDNGLCFPDPLSDCKDAVRWVRKMSGKYDFDINHIVVGGGSAGGHLALMTGWAPECVAFGAPELRGYSSAVNGVVDIFGPTDIDDLLQAGMTKTEFKKKFDKNIWKDYIEIREVLLNAFTKQDADHPKLRRKVAKAYSPVTYLNRAVPTIILHGDSDVIVPYKQSTDLYQALRKRGVPAELYTVDGDHHGFPKLTPDKGRKMAEAVSAFLRASVK